MARPRKTPETETDQVEIVCVVPDVHLGDGRVLFDSDTDFVSPAIAEILIANKQVEYV